MERGGGLGESGFFIICNLVIRDRDQPIYVPDPNNKSAKTPDVWKNGNEK
jgi:hypothetical protein